MSCLETFSLSNPCSPKSTHHYKEEHDAIVSNSEYFARRAKDFGHNVTVSNGFGESPLHLP